MKRNGKLPQRILIVVLLAAMAVFFCVMRWWIGLVIEAVLIIAAIVLIAFTMVNLILKRDKPMPSGDIAGDEGLEERQKDAVLWLESGELMEQMSEDGLKLRGRLVKNGDSHVYALCCHGYKNHRMQDIANQAKRFYDMGYNVFAGHARGHGRSEGEYIGMAVKERRDIAGWIDKLIQRDHEAKIFLYGVSMGGATVMNTSGEELPDNVRLVIEDCGYSSVWDEFVYQLGDGYGIPVHPILNLCQAISKSRYGYGFHDVSPIEQVKKTKLPILFIHGDIDTFVPYDMAKPLYEACSSEHKKLVSIKGAEHAVSIYTDPGTYWREVKSWLGAYLE
ncbi:MAG: alpha/beta hydrolase [Eubacterium sp.]|nr:alpha/beta hydrolase [Eubacterium sp.]